MTLTFRVVQCRSAFKGILGRSFLVKLDPVVSTVSLKIAYHGEEGTPTIIHEKIHEARRIRRIIHEKILVSESRGTIDSTWICMSERHISTPKH